MFRKAWESNEDGCLDKLMVAYANQNNEEEISKSDIEAMEDIAVEAEMSATEDTIETQATEEQE